MGQDLWEIFPRKLDALLAIYGLGYRTAELNYLGHEGKRCFVKNIGGANWDSEMVPFAAEDIRVVFDVVEELRKTKEIKFNITKSGYEVTIGEFQVESDTASLALIMTILLDQGLTWKEIRNAWRAQARKIIPPEYNVKTGPPQGFFDGDKNESSSKASSEAGSDSNSRSGDTNRVSERGREARTPEESDSTVCDSRRGRQLDADAKRSDDRKLRMASS